MGLFAILHHLIRPFTNLTRRSDEQRRKEMLERSLSRIPPHLRDDVVAKEKFWIYD
ncbi:hypothetical protein [Martelella endophytica]|uniref:hypothetical protein n=1 Tax=Martelella endophytica TaxID=1486262 RepID=UPI000AFDBAEF|nr:hypothetical protein [Martelella endophytica]